MISFSGKNNQNGLEIQVSPSLSPDLDFQGVQNWWWTWTDHQYKVLTLNFNDIYDMTASTKYNGNSKPKYLNSSF